MKDKSTKPIMKQSAKMKIADAAKELLCTMTEEELTMSLVAERLGITAPTLYHYFVGKDELLEAANKLTSTEITDIALRKFPKSIPNEMKIIMIMSEVIDYFKSTNLPASYLIENPLDKKSLNLDEFRKAIADLFLEYYKSKGKNPGAKRSAYQYIGAIAAEIAYCRGTKHELPEDLAGKIFAKMK